MILLKCVCNTYTSSILASYWRASNWDPSGNIPAITDRDKERKLERVESKFLRLGFPQKLLFDLFGCCLAS
uniref:Uncharacterized protein n=1 Tax=Rhizophora mucronata TaxID=61149 RepID=A0A2P2JWA9_RHIMU